jgi:hypothetical protein
MTASRAILQAARIACACVLLSCFLWTAQIVFYAPWAVARYVIALPEWVLGLSATDPGLDSFRMIDLICVTALTAMVALTFVLGRRRGSAFALLKGVQVGSMMMASLGLAIVAFNPGPLWVYMTLTQHETGFAPWFTNGVDLMASALLFGLTTYGIWNRGRPAK